MSAVAYPNRFVIGLLPNYYRNDSPVSMAQLQMKKPVIDLKYEYSNDAVWGMVVYNKSTIVEHAQNLNDLRIAFKNRLKEFAELEPGTYSVNLVPIVIPTDI
jgi:hypothetical protein